MEHEMDTEIDARVSRSRNVNMFAELSHGNWSILDRAKEKRDGYHYELMSCLMFAAFKHEAFINHLGYALIPNWNDLERKPNREKMAVITNELNITIDIGCRPFQTLRNLFRARDQIAHGKPSYLTHANVLESGDREEMRRKKPQTEWESLCTFEFAQQAYDDTEKIADMLWESAGFARNDLRSRSHGYAISNATQKPNDG